MKDRFVHRDRIRSLDPDVDHLAIYQTMVRYEFP